MTNPRAPRPATPHSQPRTPAPSTSTAEQDNRPHRPPPDGTEPHITKQSQGTGNTPPTLHDTTPHTTPPRPHQTRHRPPALAPPNGERTARRLRRRGWPGPRLHPCTHQPAPRPHQATTRHQTTPPRPHPPARRTHYEPDPDRPPSPTSAPPSPQTNPSTKDRTHTGHHHMRHPHSTLQQTVSVSFPAPRPLGVRGWAVGSLPAPTHYDSAGARPSPRMGLGLVPRCCRLRSRPAADEPLLRKERLCRATR